MVNFVQNPQGISTVRISNALVGGFADLSAAATKSEIMHTLNRMGMQIRQGTSGDNIRLFGDKGVQTHIRQSDAYIFFGKPTLPEIFKLVSLFVGEQTLDPDLHYKPEPLLGTDKQLRRPIIIYGDPEHFMPLFKMILNMHHNLGTVRQDPYSLIRFARKPDELEAVLNEEIYALDSTHGHGIPIAELADKIRYYNENTFFDCQFEKPKPGFSMVAYTSASRANQEGFDLGVFFAEHGIGGVSGAGQTGNMGQFAEGVYSRRGWAYGTNCAHIAAQEGLPLNKMIVKLTPDIYSRMGDMKLQGNGILGAVGGLGGTGTVQEILAAAMLIQQRSPLMTLPGGRNKPIICDNSLGMWEGLDRVLAPHGINEDKHYAVATSQQEVMEMTLQARNGNLFRSSSRSGGGIITIGDKPTGWLR